MARARQARELAELVGEDALSATDRSYLSFEQTVEQRLLNQRRDEARTLDETLDRAWEALRVLPRRELTMLPNAVLDARYARAFRGVVSAMAKLLHMPPGRAGRLWLQHRLSTAQHGADLLDHKLRILRTEREQLALQQDRMAAEWESASREADMWLLRGVLLGGQRSVRLAAAPAPAEVRILWEQSMGVRYPAEATCTVPDPSPGTPPPSNAALVAARDCYRRAVQAAVQQAAIDTAVRVLEAQETATRRRLRAIEDRWIPRLQQALTELQFKLEEDEHNDAVRLRWAAANRIGAERGSGSKGKL